MKILFQGDSITDSNRVKDGVHMGNGYPLLVKGTLGLESPRRYEFFNRGVSGNRVVDGVHPTPMGHEYIKNEWIKAFKKL